MSATRQQKASRRGTSIPGALQSLAAILILALVAACGANDGMSASDAGSFDEPAMAPAPDAGFAERAEAGFDTSTPPGEPMPPIAGAPTGRSVIRSGEIWLETRDTNQALDDVLALADEFGGYAATTDLRRGEDGSVTGIITLRVPAADLDTVMRRLEDLGTQVPLSRIDEYDVTTEVTDNEARLTNLKAFEAELLDLLSEVRETGGGAEELVVVFERIRDVRWEIEYLEARQRTLGDQIAMAVVTVRLTQPGGPPSVGDIQWRPSDTLATAWAATVRTLAFLADAVIWFALTILPIAVLVGAAPVGWWLWRRRRRRNHGHTTNAGAPPQDPGGNGPAA